jgi:3-isopropylmalate dehydrogenase
VTADIVLLPGDGVGPEVVAAAVRVLERIGQVRGHTFRFSTGLIGGAALRAASARGANPTTVDDGPLPASTLSAAKAADAVLLGAVGDPAFDGEPRHRRPESALLALRRELGVYANLRPARAWPGLESAGPLKPETLAGTDLVVVRELTGGLYYGEPRGIDEDGSAAVNTMRYTRGEIERVARVAFELARTRRRRVVSVDKANVLEVSQLWRAVVSEVAREYPDVALTHEYVDAAAMKLALAPASFDVLLTGNLFGDILSDEAGAVCGSLGLLPSASLGGGPGLFEPVHGSAPDLAGRDVANPIGAIASAAMLLGDGLGLRDEAAQVIAAIERALVDGLRTADIAASGERHIGTAEFADAVCRSMPIDVSIGVTPP